MSLKSNVNVHAVLWVLLFWLYIIVLLGTTGWQGEWYDRKYMYALRPETQDVSLWNIEPMSFEADIKKRAAYGDALLPWPSGKKMNQFKNDFGCFGDERKTLAAILATADAVTEAQKFSMIEAQHKFNNGPSSVCTCIDKLYYASFQKYMKYGAETLNQILPAFVRTELTTTFASSTLAEDLKRWMLEDDMATRTQRYDGTAFTSLMANAKSTDAYMQCDHYDKDDKKLSDKTMCILRRDIEILSVCSRAAQNTYQIDFRGIVNASFVSAFAVLCLFWFMFVTIYRHINEPDSKVFTVLRFLVYLSMLGNAGFLLFYYIGMNWGFPSSTGWWTEPWTWDLHRATVLFASTLGALDVVFVLIVFAARMARTHEKETNAVRLEHMLLERPTKLQNIILAQMLTDIPFIVGFSVFFNGVLLESGISETHSLGVVVVMGMVVGFTQHLSNVLHETSIRHLNFDETTNPAVPTAVDADTYRFVNEVAKHRLYIVVLSAVVCAYLVVFPRESFATAGHMTYALSVLTFFLVCSAFDVVRQVDNMMVRSMWISVSDKEKVKSAILFVFILGLMLSRGAASREHVALDFGPDSR